MKRQPTAWEAEVQKFRKRDIFSAASRENRGRIRRPVPNFSDEQLTSLDQEMTHLIQEGVKTGILNADEVNGLILSHIWKGPKPIQKEEGQWNVTYPQGEIDGNAIKLTFKSPFNLTYHYYTATGHILERAHRNLMMQRLDAALEASTPEWMRKRIPS